MRFPGCTRKLLSARSSQVGKLPRLGRFVGGWYRFVGLGAFARVRVEWERASQWGGEGEGGAESGSLIVVCFCVHWIN